MMRPDWRLGFAPGYGAIGVQPSSARRDYNGELLRLRRFGVHFKVIGADGREIH